ncbi:DNA-3-methyladenine glycosylase I [Algoriella xinjiangensis]|uniref:DNA-3-methyladenine glycosylase I n=1 Tax=Algoriella xinjiangensis TaxID=684065 RepID=A0A1I4TE94_9FLAO|nr:DNA-3-methyladenine glycosylase I [Algoriella xinjiangensis]SFM74923.1 DNA-3-methyladenine glycosylase I [Algoriella xinjiangensis]VDH14997.1 DNA-3-methyladenine glycosylase 1 [Algoriella xinjiangensis]
MENTRCAWVGKDQIYIDYHDNEWGKPVYDDKILFEFLVLESFQAGLSWITILKKRENFRKAFANFDVEKIANFTEDDVEKLVLDEGIIRHRGKINAAINNAKLFIELQKEHESFSNFIWKYVNHQPIVNNWNSIKEVPATTEISDQIAKDLKKIGFKFFGSTTIYAHMQATGMVNDHTKDCFCK